MASFGRRIGFATAVWLTAAAAVAQPLETEQPCAAYSGSTSIFTGVAGTPVMRSVRLPDHPPIEMKLTPVAVDRVFLGPTAPIMYLTPRGVEQYATPGQTYLVYGTGYRPPDIVMASPGYGAKEIETAADDLTFLESLTPGAGGGTIAGVVEQRDAPDGMHGARAPVRGVPVRIFNDHYSTQATTDAEGRFVAYLEFPGGHLESEPYVFTGTTGKTVVKLRPDAPRRLHP